jgi:hypothetical protein
MVRRLEYTFTFQTIEGEPGRRGALVRNPVIGTNPIRVQGPDGALACVPELLRQE